MKTLYTLSLHRVRLNSGYFLDCGMNQRFVIILTFYLLLFAGFSTKAEVLLGNEREYVFEQKDWKYFLDSTSSLKPKDINSDDFGELKTNFFDASDNTHWLTLTYKCLPSTPHQKFVFEIYSVHTSRVDFYILQNDQIISHEMGGYETNFPGDRKFITKNIVFDVPFKEGQSYDILIKIKTSRDVDINYRFSSLDRFTNYATREYWYLGIYYGALSLLIFYAVAMFLGSMNRVYLYYGLFIFTSILVSFTEDITGYEFFWSNYPWVNDWVDYYCNPIFHIIALTVYVAYYLKLKKESLKTYKLLWLINVAFVIVDIFDISLLGLGLDNYLRLIPYGILLFLTFQSHFKNKKVPTYFLLGIALVFVGQVFYPFRYSRFIPSNIFTVYFFNFTMIIEALLFMLAISAQVKKYRKEKDEAQKEVVRQMALKETSLKNLNESLELKVKDRTKELQKSNSELIESKEELKNLVDNLHKINSKLDYDNWKLGKEVKEELTRRVRSEDLGYEEYLKVYPDNLSCIRLLEELKWKDGFKCKKCGNRKYAEHGKSYARKCTSCNTVDSPTTDTLLHGIRFPVQKAFYISYCVSSKKEITIETLAEKLSLNKNTVAKFKNKCQDRRKELKEKDNWYHMIYHKK